jgi:D-sedoheptulose 7-phosphate isomerase
MYVIIRKKTMREIFYKNKKKILNIFSSLKYDKNFDILCKESIEAIENKKKIIFFGNGGSAADAQHLATELTCKFKKKRKALPGLALTTDTSALTAIGNDFGFKYIFARQIEAIGNSGDIAIAITTSGNSINLIEAIKAAKKRKIITFCFSGNKGGKLKKFVKYPIIFKSNETDVLQVVEIAIGQIYCSILEDFFFKNEKN